MKIKIALILAIGLFFACKKEKKEDEVTVKTDSEVESLIKGGKWDIYKAVVIFKGMEGTIGFEECEEDNYLEFSSGTYTENEGAISCDPSSAYNSTWSLSADEKKMTFEGVEQTITKLTKDSMNLYYEFNDEDGVTKYYIYYKNIK